MTAFCVILVLLYLRCRSTPEKSASFARSSSAYCVSICTFVPVTQVVNGVPRHTPPRAARASSSSSGMSSLQMKIQIHTARIGRVFSARYVQFTCFTSTKVQILTHKTRVSATASHALCSKQRETRYCPATCTTQVIQENERPSERTPSFQERP